MLIIAKEAAADGSRPAIQTWGGATPPDTHWQIKDGLDTSVFTQYNGFVYLTVMRDIVVGIIPNEEAWEAWKAQQPESEPEPASETQLLGQEITNLQLAEIEQGQYATDLDLRIREMEGSSNV